MSENPGLTRIEQWRTTPPAVRDWACSQCGQRGKDHKDSQCPAPADDAPEFRPDLMDDGEDRL
jgi:hypothetical protein